MSNLNEPVLPGTAKTDYERYLRTDELLALQKEPESAAHRDEILFQVIHQSSELWLKLACFEVETAIGLLDNDQAWSAVRLLRRSSDGLDLVLANTRMLEHLAPWDYHGVRPSLGHGSGFDSPGFRRTHELSPKLGEAFDRLLARRGVSLPDVYKIVARSRRPVPDRRAAARLGSAADPVARPSPQARRASDRRPRHRHAGHARRGAEPTDQCQIFRAALECP